MLTVVPNILYHILGFLKCQLGYHGVVRLITCVKGSGVLGPERKREVLVQERGVIGVCFDNIVSI